MDCSFISAVQPPLVRNRQAHHLARATTQFHHCRSHSESGACLVLPTQILLPMDRRFVSAFVRSLRLVGRLSYYSISSDYSPTPSFDEDGDSFTSFGSIQTPPRLRAMIRSIFDGTLNSPIRSFPDSDSYYAASPREGVSDYVPSPIVTEGLHHGETFGDHRDRLLAALAPSTPDRAPAIDSSASDEEYELDDCALSYFNPSLPCTNPNANLDLLAILVPTPRTDQDHPTIVAGSPNSTSPGYVPNAHIDVGENVGLFNPNDDSVSHVDPRLQLLSEDNNQSDIDSVFSLLDPYEDPTDTTYVPPKKNKQSYAGRKRSSGSLSPKPKPAFVRPRDSKGRFVSLRSKNLGKLKATSVDDQLPRSSSSSTSLPQAVVDSGHPHLTETALNTFLNTVLTSPDEAFPLSFHLPDPFAAHFSLAGPSVLGTNPFIPPTPFIHMRPDDPRLQFRTSFVDLLRAIVPFLSNFTPSPDDHESFKLLNHAVVVSATEYMSQYLSCTK
ncbi:hypothetical protein PGT21_021528 [Puccinia graminis f. sp. tritici]|uniref:Uncharacterized protein n=1 Tax=Puccinia graminis f. sp. tritici TaxID=56615 RepID=A0A5B0PL01_PUCGR|nr:hypothetical protein PGT21_021528 [Puccinia graminis f. sp. tritici]